MKINNKNAFPYKFTKKFKGPLILYQKFLNAMRELIKIHYKNGRFSSREFRQKSLQNCKSEKLKNEKVAFRTASQG